MSRNRLSQVDAIKLADWLRENQSEIENGMTGPQVASSARRELGIRVTGATVVRIGGSLGITFKNSKRASGQTSRLQIVARSVARLYEALDEEVPEELADLID